MREEDTTLTDYELGKKLVEKWEGISEAERIEYTTLSLQDQEARKKAKLLL